MANTAADLFGQRSPGAADVTSYQRSMMSAGSSRLPPPRAYRKLAYRMPAASDRARVGSGIGGAHSGHTTSVRRGAIPGVVVRGSVRLLAVVVATREDVQAADLQPTDYQKWRELRAQLWSREEARRQQWRFRKDPATYLAALEAQLLE